MSKEFTNKDLNLTLLMEECGEVMKVSTKIKHYGINDRDQGTKVSNRQELLNKIGDLHALLAVVIEDYEFTIEEIDDRAELKLDALEKYYTELH